MLGAGEPIKAISGDGLREPHGLVFDAHCTLYGTESVRTNRIFKLQGGRIEFISGVRWDSSPEGQEPPAPAKPLDLAPALYHGPADIVVANDGSLYVVDTFQHRIVRLDPATHSTTAFAGTGQAGFAGDGGRADRARFNILSGGVIDPAGKYLLVADLGNHRIRRIDLTTQVVTTIAGNGQQGFPQDGADALKTSMDYVRSVCVAKDGTVYALLIRKDALVAIKDGKVEVVVNKAGETGPATDGPAAEAQMNKPKSITMDAKGNVLILDTENHCLRLFDPVQKTIRTIAGNGKAGSALGKDWASTQLNRPHGARVGTDGRLYVADSENNRILVGTAP